eukprot:gene3658-4204_t
MSLTTPLRQARCYSVGNKGPLKVLGIETSCDDTSIAVVTSDRRILGEYKKAQWDIHSPFNGIVPKLASQAHKDVIDEAVDGALLKANLKIEDIDAIAVTTGPGIAFALEVGLNKARQLSKEHNKPFLSVNHLEGHCLVARLSDPSLEFPFMTLLVSGGHTQLLVCHGVGSYTLLGNTLDDSVGEALDKSARMLGCTFGEVDDGHQIYRNIHGGEAIEILARRGKPIHKFTIPMQGSKNCDFSFSGLKSSMMRIIAKIKEGNADGELTLQDKYDLAASFQDASIKHLEKKTMAALIWYNANLGRLHNGILFQRLKGLVITGGVSKNQMLRRRFDIISADQRVPLFFPEMHLCTDNGAMIAWAGIEMYNHNKTSNPDDAFFLPVWPLDSNPCIFRSNLKEKDVKLRKEWYTSNVEKYGPGSKHKAATNNFEQRQVVEDKDK